MSFEIIATPKFKTELKRLVNKFPSLKTEYSNLIDQLNNNPKLGIPIGHDCYKIRLSIRSKGKGKSGGARVITYIFIEGEILFLLSIFDKSERANITDSELINLIKKIE